MAVNLFAKKINKIKHNMDTKNSKDNDTGDKLSQPGNKREDGSFSNNSQQN